jgi:hypothetical protein
MVTGLIRAKRVEVHVSGATGAHSNTARTGRGIATQLDFCCSSGWVGLSSRRTLEA